jgi:hypothetical protein
MRDPVQNPQTGALLGRLYGMTLLNVIQKMLLVRIWALVLTKDGFSQRSAVSIHKLTAPLFELPGIDRQSKLNRHAVFQCYNYFTRESRRGT